MGTNVFRKCHDSRPCFARREGKCVALTSTYPPGTCPFQKEDGRITNGKKYPKIDGYVQGGANGQT